MIKRKETFLFTFFIDLEGRVSFSYVHVRDQNLVVWGRNCRLICFVFFICFEKGFKIKKTNGKKDLFVFFKLKENRLNVLLN